MMLHDAPSSDGCASCPHIQPGSCFDGRHLYCERMHAWTNLLSPEWRGQCFFGADGVTQLILDFTDGDDGDDGADDADESQPQPR